MPPDVYLVIRRLASGSFRRVGLLKDEGRRMTCEQVQAMTEHSQDSQSDDLAGCENRETVVTIL